MKEPELIKINPEVFSWHNVPKVYDQVCRIWNYAFTDSGKTKVITHRIWIYCGSLIHNEYQRHSDFNPVENHLKKGDFTIHIIFDPLLNPWDSFLKLDPNGEGFKLTELDSEKKSP